MQKLTWTGFEAVAQIWLQNHSKTADLEYSYFRGRPYIDTLDTFPWSMVKISVLRSNIVVKLRKTKNLFRLSDINIYHR